MATAKLVMKFGTLNGEKTFTIGNITTETMTSAQVKTLMDTIITNGSIYQYPPLTKVSAVRQVTDEDEFDLSD